MAQVTNSTCDSDVSVSDNSGTRATPELQGHAPLKKSHLEHGSTRTSPSLSRAWEWALVFSQGLMRGSGTGPCNLNFFSALNKTTSHIYLLA